MKRETIQRVATPTAILVGLPDGLAGFCTEVLGEGGLRVLRAAHAAAAAERIPVVMPQLVVVAPGLHPNELDTLTDRCVAVGAEVLAIPENVARTELQKTLNTAANTALIKALRGS